jgi:hypothetical protein
MPALYGELDRAVGHLRRYDRDELSAKLVRHWFAVEMARYVNLPGLFGWYLKLAPAAPSDDAGRAGAPRRPLRPLDLLADGNRAHPLDQRADRQSLVEDWHDDRQGEIGPRARSLAKADALASTRATSAAGHRALDFRTRPAILERGVLRSGSAR